MTLYFWLGRDGPAVWSEYETARAVEAERLANAPVVDSTEPADD